MIKRLYLNTYRLNEWGPFGNVKIYLLIGKEKAMLIDSGYGQKDLSKEIRKITKNPVKVFLTHGHIDHAGGTFRFSDVYLKKEDQEVFRRHTSFDFMSKHLKTSPHEYPIPQEIHLGKIDLGDREIEIVSTPGHTPGSVSFVDREGKVAFVGDFINPWDTWLGLEESLEVKEFLNSLKQFKKVIQDNDIKKIYSGHNLIPMTPQIIEDYIIFCEKIIRGEIKNQKYKNKGICKGFFSKYKKAKLIYKKESIK